MTGLLGGLRRNGAWRFLREFIAVPDVIGAVAPSSWYLAEKMVEGIDWSDVRVVVEYGPGTGAFTGHILGKLNADSVFFAIELNQAVADIFERRFPKVSLHRDSVARVEEICAMHGLQQVDCVVSALPWAAFSEEQQDFYLEKMLTVLNPRGYFVTFAYLHGLALPAGRTFSRKLYRNFQEVSCSKTVWLNIPPAFVYRCRP